MKFGKKVIRFDEPRVVRKRYYPYPLIPRWGHVVSLAIMLIMSAIAIFVRSDDTSGDRIAMMGVGVVMGLAGGYGIPLLDQLGSSTISIGPGGIERMDSLLGYQIPILMLMGYRRHRWKWPKVRVIMLVCEAFGEKAFDVLKVYGDDDQLLGCVGLGAKTKVSDVVLRIEANGGIVVRPEINTN